MRIENPFALDLTLPIQSKRCYIRPITPDDSPMAWEALTETWDLLQPWLSWAQTDPFTLEQTRETLHKLYAQTILRKEFHFAIFSDEQFIGGCSLHAVNWRVPSADIGYWLRRSYQGRGLMTEAVQDLVHFGFDQMQLQRITLSVDDKNTQSIAIAERTGFSLETRALGLLPCLMKDTKLRMGRIYVRFAP